MKSENLISSVGIGEIGIVKGEGKLAIYGLGSCIGLILFNEKDKIGALAHILLPGPRLKSDETNDLPAKYGDEALKTLLNMMDVKEFEKHYLKAGIIGGATLFSNVDETSSSIGEKNVLGIESWIRQLKIKVAWQDTGGNYGRSLLFEIPSGQVKVRTLKSGWQILPPNG